MNTKQAPGAWYALRRTLPTWSFDENLEELTETLPRYGVDELIVKVDTEEFTHGQPPIDWVRRYQPNLFRISEAMSDIGVRYSLNPWITVGHTDRGRDARRQLPGIRTVVGHDGVVCTCCACPLSPVWRENANAVWTLYAETAPHVLWVEDDIRTFNHRPVEYGCFCDEHMRLFSERVGERVRREGLVEALLAPGVPHPWRGEFLDMQAETMIETVGFLARVVHEASPDTSLGLMSSGPRTHCLEGRRWRDFAEALADGKPLYSRPPMGNYSESSLRGFYYSHDSIKITRSCLPDGVIEQTEVENVPFTRYSKSVHATFIEMAISFAYGSPGVTMNLFDHCGTPMEREGAFGLMLGERKPYFDALVRRAAAPGTYRGVRLLFNERESYHKRLDSGAPTYAGLGGDGYATMLMLESHGLPTTYEESTVVATSGQQLRAFSDREIESMLSAGVLLDGTAATVLVERGFGPEIGIRSIEPARNIDTIGAFSAEEFHNPDFGGTDKRFLTLTVPGLGGRPDLCLVDPGDGILEVSHIVDPDARRRHLCMYAFGNRLGGRVVVHLLDLASAYGVAFNHTFRETQLHGAVRWLTHGRVPIAIRGDGVYPLGFCRDSGDRSLIGLFNLTLDPWSTAEIDLFDTRDIDAVETLSPDGQWEPCAALSWTRSVETVTLEYRGAIPYDTPLFVSVSWTTPNGSR